MDCNAAESFELHISRRNKFCNFNAQNKFNPLKSHHASSTKKNLEKDERRGKFANEIEIHGFVEQKVAENEVAGVSQCLFSEIPMH